MELSRFDDVQRAVFGTYITGERRAQVSWPVTDTYASDAAAAAGADAVSGQNSHATDARVAQVSAQSVTRRVVTSPVLHCQVHVNAWRVTFATQSISKHDTFMMTEFDYVCILQIYKIYLINSLYYIILYYNILVILVIVH